ncbi:hypothetical protein BGZ49_005554 [Haplosporangium sp. Z 27]|nr:hypothetical protein BGZ49_005554 [Haplosporangium sp. Z 27]
MGGYDPILSKPRDSEDIDLEVLHHSGVQSHRNRRRTSDGSITELGSGSGPSRLEVGSDDQDFSDDGGEEQESMVQDEKLNRTGEASPFEHCLAFLKAAFDYSQSFWLLFLLSFLLIGVQVPFNSIHAGFLQMRWYPNDPQKAAQIMTVPDLLSAILVLPIGFFVDHYGQKSWLFMLCGLTIGFSHFVLGLIRIPTPVPVLMALGIASAIGATITSAIPILVKNHQIATA